MRKIALLLLTILCCSQSLPAQQSNEDLKADRRIYLWDVTLSMKGQGNPPTEDIYDKVMEYLIKDIERVKDPNTEFIVCPFQAPKAGEAAKYGNGTIKEVWKSKDFSNGKKGVIDAIKSYNNTVVTNTDIVGSIEYAKDKFLDKKKKCVFILFTDGEQSNSLGGSAALKQAIREWGKQANGSLMWYFMLTQAAKGGDLIDVMNETGGTVKPVDPEDVDNPMFNLTPSNEISANIKDIKDNQFITVAILQDEGGTIPDMVKFKISTNDAVLNVLDGTPIVDMVNNTIKIPLKYDYESLKAKIRETYGEIATLPLNLELILPDSPQSNITLTSNIVNLKLINKPEKVLKITIKPKKQK